MVAHVVLAVFAFLTVYFTYRIGALLDGPATGLIASVLLLTYPLFRAQSTVVALDLPTAAFAMMALDGLLRRRTPTYLVCSSAMLLTKETSLLFVPAALLYVLVRDRRRPASHLAAALALHAAPVVVLAGWFAYHWWATGWLLPADKLASLGHAWAYAPARIFTHDGAAAVAARLALRYFGTWSLVGVLSLAIVVHAASFGLRGQPVWRAWGPPERLALLGLPIVLQVAALPFWIPMHRYLMPAYPLFFLLAAAALTGTLATRARVGVAAAFMAAVFAAGAASPRDGASLESPSTLGYASFVAVDQMAASFVEEHYPTARVLAAWPQYLELAMPIQGYVSRPLAIVGPAGGSRDTRRFMVLGGRSVGGVDELADEDFDLVLYSERAHGPDAALLRAVIARSRLPIVAEFRSGPAGATVYGRAARSG
jgi:4-amino-4-deoxy-L-arabinose transferase-like glycosyltransferase